MGTSGLDTMHRAVKSNDVGSLRGDVMHQSLVLKEPTRVLVACAREATQAPEVERLEAAELIASGETTVGSIGAVRTESARAEEEPDQFCVAEQ
jgi:hypothetical protein